MVRPHPGVRRQRREDFDRLRYATAETLTLDPLPCWEGLSEQQIRVCVSNLVGEIEFEAQSALGDREPLGPEAILAQDPPHSHPKQAAAGCRYWRRAAATSDELPLLATSCRY
ncbi:MAG TPA: hypothetical protein VKK31_10635 [Thermoanaerobaculia bacterium]|nr:hypothetical protein [Thermoanaerobaculia bacterium]